MYVSSIRQETRDKRQEAFSLLNLSTEIVSFFRYILGWLFRDFMSLKSPKNFLKFSYFYFDNSFINSLNINSFWKYYYENNILIKNLKNAEKIGEGEKNAI